MSGLLLSLLAGCATGWIDQAPACEHDVYDWSDDLLGYVLTGDGSGAFDFDPVDTPRTRVHGVYEPTTGNFLWNTTFGEEYFLQKVVAEGYGTVYHNGDLDLLWTQVATDILGEEFSTVWRVNRLDCDLRVATWPEDDETSALEKEGEYEDAESWAWAAEDELAEYHGTTRQNLAETFVSEAVDGSATVSITTKPTGIAESEWSQACGSNGVLLCEGTSLRRFDGGQEDTYSVFQEDDLVYDVVQNFGYDGDGTITWTTPEGDSLECTYDQDGDDCKYECDDDTSGETADTLCYGG